MRKRAGVGVGDKIKLVLKLDTKPRIVPIPEELAKELKRNKKAKTAWEKLSPSHRKEILSYLNFLKTPEALQRNIKKLISTHLKIS